MADNDNTQHPSTQAGGSIQAVRTANEPIQLNEGYQPLERKGYQPTVTPLRSVPPQSVSAAIPFVATPTTDSNTTAPAAPATPAQPQTSAATSQTDAQK
jgi:hypothetical protein